VCQRLKLDQNDLCGPAKKMTCPARGRIDPDDNDEADVAGNAVVVAGLQVVRVVAFVLVAFGPVRYV
jgi:hypothetical protein